MGFLITKAGQPFAAVSKWADWQTVRFRLILFQNPFTSTIPTRLSRIVQHTFNKGSVDVPKQHKVQILEVIKVYSYPNLPRPLKHLKGAMPPYLGLWRVSPCGRSPSLSLIFTLVISGLPFSHLLFRPSEHRMHHSFPLVLDWVSFSVLQILSSHTSLGSQRGLSLLKFPLKGGYFRVSQDTSPVMLQLTSLILEGLYPVSQTGSFSPKDSMVWSPQSRLCLIFMRSVCIYC